MDNEELGEILNSICLLHLIFKKNGFKYENFDENTRLTFNHYLTLKILENGEMLAMSEIRNLIGINKKNMTYLTDKLVQNGSIKRVSDMNDRRVINIVITDKGKEYLSEWQKIKTKEIIKIFSSFDDEELKKFYYSIETIKNLFSKIRSK
jgi:DNA-binding MarR family transcriptional regulator